MREMQNEPTVIPAQLSPQQNGPTAGRPTAPVQNEATGPVTSEVQSCSGGARTYTQPAGNPGEDASCVEPAVPLSVAAPPMNRSGHHRFRRSNAVAYALIVNAVLLLAILVVLVGGRDGGLHFLQPAYADPMGLAPQPIAGGGGMYLMPAQFSSNTWGCYVMDIDQQTLCAYQYLPGDHLLRLVAARNFTYDRKLKNYNTGSGPGEMSPAEVKRLVEKQQDDARVNPNEQKPQPDTSK